jgi:hypothetical protein
MIWGTGSAAGMVLVEAFASEAFRSASCFSASRFSVSRFSVSRFSASRRSVSRRSASRRSISRRSASIALICFDWRSTDRSINQPDSADTSMLRLGAA